MTHSSTNTPDGAVPDEGPSSSTFRRRGPGLPRALLPALLVAAFLVVLGLRLQELATARGPFHLAQNQDPSYIFLMDGLNLAQGRAAMFHHQPGAPLSLLLGGIILATHGLAGEGPAGEGMALAVLRDPERILRLAEAACILAYAGGALWLTLALRAGPGGRSGGRPDRLADRWPLAAAALPLVWLAGNASLLLEFRRVTPELLLVPCCVWLFLSALRAARRDDDGTRAMIRAGTRAAWAAGLAIGLGAALKFTMLPCLLLAAFLPGWRKKAALAGGFVLAFGLGTIPVWHAYPEMASWLASLVLTRQWYGAGGAGLPEAGLLLENLTMAWTHERVLFWHALVFPAAALLCWRTGREDPARLAAARLLAWGGLLLMAQLVMSLKGYNARYLYVSHVMTACLDALLLRQCLAIPRSRWRLAGAGLTLAFFLVQTHLATRSFDDWMTILRRHRDGQAAAMAALERELAACPDGQDALVAGYYRCSLPSCALAFGAGLTSRREAEAFQKAHPGFVAYSPGTGAFHDAADRDVTPRVETAVRNGTACLFLAGTPLDTPGYGEYTRLPMRSVHRGPEVEILRVP